MDTNQSVDIVLTEGYTLSNPTSLEVLSNGSVSYSSLYVNQDGVYKTSTVPWSPPFLLNRTNNSNYGNDIQTAGYVNIEDVDYTIFDLANIPDSVNITEIGVGDIIWTAKDYQQNWNVYRVTETEVNAVNVSNALNGQISINTNISHGLLENDTILIKNIDRFSGFYKVKFISSLKSFTETRLSSIVTPLGVRQ